MLFDEERTAVEEIGQLKSTRLVWPTGDFSERPVWILLGVPLSSEIKMFLSCGHRQVPLISGDKVGSSEGTSYVSSNFFSLKYLII